MKIQKYKALIRNTDTKVIGYISEIRQFLGEGAYGNGVDYLITVTEISMPGGPYGSYVVEPGSVEKVGEQLKATPMKSLTKEELIEMMDVAIDRLKFKRFMAHIIHSKGEITFEEYNRGVDDLTDDIEYLKKLNKECSEDEPIHRNAELIVGFMEYCKDNGYELPETLFEGFFEA